MGGGRRRSMGEGRKEGPLRGVESRVHDFPRNCTHFFINRTSSPWPSPTVRHGRLPHTGRRTFVPPSLTEGRTRYPGPFLTFKDGPEDDGGVDGDVVEAKCLFCLCLQSPQKRYCRRGRVQETGTLQGAVRNRGWKSWVLGSYRV